MALWTIVHERCVPHFDAGEGPKPLRERRSLAPRGQRRRAAEGPQSASRSTSPSRPAGSRGSRTLSSSRPTRPAISLSPGRRGARSRGGCGRTLPREAVGVAVNSAFARSQDQLHLHVDCMDKDVVDALSAYQDALDEQWRVMTVALKGRHYWARRLEFRPIFRRRAVPLARRRPGGREGSHGFGDAGRRSARISPASPASFFSPITRSSRPAAAARICRITIAKPKSGRQIAVGQSKGSFRIAAAVNRQSPGNFGSNGVVGRAPSLGGTPVGSHCVGRGYALRFETGDRARRVIALPAAACAVVRIDVDLGAQTMRVATDAGESFQWPISSGGSGHETPRGTFRPTMLFPMVYSYKYNNEPMPHSIFFHGQYAIHGTIEEDALGRPASHGCIRLAPSAAATLFALVSREGALIRIGGEPPRRATSPLWSSARAVKGARSARRGLDPGDLSRAARRKLRLQGATAALGAKSGEPTTRPRSVARPMVMVVRRLPCQR